MTEGSPFTKLTKAVSGLSKPKKALAVLMMGTVVIFAISDYQPDDGWFYGEVWGDLEATGRITQEYEYDRLYVYHYNVPPQGQTRREMEVTVTGVEGILISNLPDWNGSWVNETVDVGSETVTIRIDEGHFTCHIRDVTMVYRYSEYRGQAFPNGGFNDPDYEVFISTSDVEATGYFKPGDTFELSDATITIDGEDHYLRKASLNISGDGLLPIHVWSEAGLAGDRGPLPGKYDHPVRIDGRLVIEDFVEVNEQGSPVRSHERLVIDGDNIEIYDHGGPYTWEKWSFNLEPWTLEIRTDDLEGISSTNYTRPLIGSLLLWGLALILIVAIVSRPRPTPDTTARRPPEDPPIPISGQEVTYPVKVSEDGTTVSPGKVKAAFAAGVLCMANCLMALILTISSGGYLIDTLCLLVGVILPIIGIIGGAFAVMRKSFGFAVVGAVATMFSPGFTVMGPVCVPLPWIGLIALALIIHAREAFTPVIDMRARTEQLQGGWRP
ncbi:MAG: hypothetical protein JSW25_01085 [Thermoplasmata archaeon]|nr:MAG: hypothetical protein JSW25_01085 [Thermoplasmata archaeon]